MVHGDRNIFIKKYDEDAFYTTDLNDVFRCRICATNLLSSTPSLPHPNSNATKLLSRLYCFVAKLLVAYQEKSQ